MTDEEYVKYRNKLIPSAMREANEKHGKNGKRSDREYTINWNVTFLDAMNRKWKELLPQLGG